MPSIRFHPADTRSGTAGASARKIASECGPASVLPKVVAAGKPAFRMHPGGMCTWIGRRTPSLCGRSGSSSMRSVSRIAEKEEA